jgi:tetratricopeptide (TPR) repeat protein
VKKPVLLLILLVLYLCVLFPFTSYMKNRPLLEKLGYVPRSEIMQFAAADQKQFTSAALVMKVLFYFGGLVEQAAKRIYTPPDFTGMQTTIETAVKLDPYNMDAYYFAQAVMVWDMKQVKAANDLLEYGMQYRDWDWYLPFFAGFNCGYFLKEYETAAKYFKRVGELTGNDLSISLASRYMYEAGKTDMAIAYLIAMEKGARNDAIKKTFRARLDAFKGVKLIETARDRYFQQFSKLPSSIDILVKSGLLQALPVDPYGGTFYLAEKGQVRSTSKFAFAGKKEQ